MTTGFDWTPLEQSVGARPRRRIHPGSAQNLFYGLSHPGRLRQLSVRLPPDQPIPELAPLNTRGLQIITDADSRATTVTIQLQDDDLRQVFDALTTDIADHVAATTTADDALATLIDRMVHWADLFRRLAGPTLLTPEEQRGLYGELLVLGQLLSVVGAPAATTAWTGPLAASQDFQIGDVAIEVKTASGTLPQRLMIPNERELDDTDVPTLILTRILVDERPDGGGTDLNTAAAALRDRLRAVPAAVATFDTRLDRHGYHYEPEYDQPRYTVRDISRWQVRDDFPRITAAELRAGVGDVSYTIDPSTATTVINETDMNALLTAAGDGVPAAGPATPPDPPTPEHDG